MYWLKSCPRCRGDLHEEEDQYGSFIVCVQCGYVATPIDEDALRAKGELREGPVTAETRVA